MRTTFIKTLEELAKKNCKIHLLTGDLGFSVFESFINQFPKQYLNAGIAEQNMTGVAAGMAIEDKIPIIYSIIPFCTMRNFEQIRNDICYQNLNVKIVGMGAGFTYGPYGHTHHALEDIGILRTLPNMTIFSPADSMEVGFVTKEAIKIKGPVYIRLGRLDKKITWNKNFSLKMGKGRLIREGKDVTLITTGSMLSTGLEVCEKLDKKNIASRLISMHTIKPLDIDIIVESAKKTGGIFTLEEHFLTGGLGSLVAEVLAENLIKIPFRRLGVRDHFTRSIGSQEYMRKVNELSIDQIESSILKSIKQ